MNDANCEHHATRKKKVSNKMYNTLGARGVKIPGSTQRSWKSVRRIQRSVTRDHRGNRDKCEESAQVSEVNPRKERKENELETIESADVDAESGPSTRFAERETMEIVQTERNESVLHSDRDTIEDNSPMNTIANSPGQNQTSVTEDATKLYSDEVLVQTLLLMALKFRHNLTYTAAEDIVQLNRVLSGSIMEKASKYNWKKILHDFSSHLKIHHVCSTCESYIGESTGVIIHCDHCDNDLDVKSNIKSHNIFIYISLAQQLQNIFETTDAHESLHLKRRPKFRAYGIEDIFDGKMYKETMDEESISVNFSVDGAPVFDSSNFSIWPLLCTINEFEPTKRRKNVLLCSLWFGQGKPKMSEYLTPFVTESKMLCSEGFEYKYQGSVYKKKCRVLVCISDSVARPLLRNSRQFNGEYGCGLCLHPGERIARGRGFTRVYPLGEGNEPFPEGLRTNEGTKHHSKTKEKGIKGPSILSEIPGFDIIQCITPDWMHAVPLGVCRQFASLWFDSSNHSKGFYLGHLCGDIDSFLQSISPDLEVSRTPRDISDRVHWKAHEWAIFLMFYSLPILREFCQQKYVNHWALLVDGISILLRVSLMPSEIEYSRGCLIDFIAGVEKLYGREHISFNVHLLSHFPLSVLNWGPLWTHSAFPYENANQELLRSVKSSNGVALQICDTFRLKCVVDKLYISCFKILTESQIAFLDKLLNNTTKAQPTLIVNDTGMLGSASFLHSLPREEYIAFQRLKINIDEKSVLEYYQRAIVGGELFHSRRYSRVVKRANYYALLCTDELFEIEVFIVVKINNERVCFAIGKYFEKANTPFIRGRKLRHLVVLRKRYNNLAVVNTSLLKEKVTLIERNDTTTLVACVHPNRYELLT